MSKVTAPPEVRRAFKLAVAQRKKAYAPYSKFKVGAALITDRGQIYTGCNVENVSYGGTICAERVAITKAVSEGKKKFTDVVVVASLRGKAVSPCGLCLQTLAEFLKPSANIWLATPQGIKAVVYFGDILPLGFGPKEFKR